MSNITLSNSILAFLNFLAVFAAATSGIAIFAYVLGWIETITILKSIKAEWLISEYPISFFCFRSILYFILTIPVVALAFFRMHLLYQNHGKDAVMNYPIFAVFTVILFLGILIYLTFLILGNFSSQAKHLLDAFIVPHLLMTMIAVGLITGSFLIAASWKLGALKSQFCLIGIMQLIFCIFLMLPVAYGLFQVRDNFADNSSNLPIIELNKTSKEKYLKEDERLRLLLHNSGRYYALRFPKGKRYRPGVIILEPSSIESILPV